VCAIVKGDAYGHGAIECARALEQAGCKWFGVSSIDEGMQLRTCGIRGRILLMSGFWSGDEATLIEQNLTPAVWDWSQIELLEEAAHRRGSGKATPAPVHLKIDTGMGRLGVHVAEVRSFATSIKAAQHVLLEGVFTHLASAEVVGSPSLEAQLKRFDDALSVIAEAGLSPAYHHMANSSAIANRRETWKNMVRPGISLYGYYLPFTSSVTGVPDPSLELPVKPVLTWKTRILAVRDFPARSPIGYSGAYITPTPARIAVLPVGYADGLNRLLSSQGRVIVRNQYTPIVGNVSMDMTMIDVTGVPGADAGDEVTILGSSGEHRISAWEHAGLAHTIPYETLCNISKRVQRRYVE
jgi:alanine racemase